MRKLLFTLAGLGLAPAAFAQVEIGLKISPGVSWVRASSPSQTNFQNDGARFSFGGGVFMDYFFGENYAFNTGLFLTNKGGSYTYREPTVAGSTTQVTVSQKLAVQYLEIPATIKLFTNEIGVGTDTRLYFQVGGSVGFPVGARLNDEKYYTDPFYLSGGTQGTQTQASDHVLFIDANLLGGIGAEYQLGKSTKALLGLSYHHGLIDFDRYFEKNRKFDGDVDLKNSVIALDLGLKF